MLLIFIFCFYNLIQPNFARNTPTTGEPNLPDLPSDAPSIARYIIHNVDWVSMATISIQEGIKGYPFVGIKSVVDGPVSKGTGIPYFYTTDLDVSTQDLKKNNRVTIVATLAQTDYCKGKHYIPQDPRCPKVMITGKFVTVSQSDPDYAFAVGALFARHPSMKYWPEDHGFHVAKINVEQVRVLAKFGGMQNVSVDDYFKTT